MEIPLREGGKALSRSPFIYFYLDDAISFQEGVCYNKPKISNPFPHDLIIPPALRGLMIKEIIGLVKNKKETLCYFQNCI